MTVKPTISKRPARYAGVISLVYALAACNHQGEPSATPLQQSRQALMNRLSTQSVVEPGQMLSHLSHVCSLLIEGKPYPVVDVQALVRGAQTPRGVNTILILAPSLDIVRRIDYTTERPLFCAGNRLYVWGDLQIDGVEGTGNELTFTNDAGVTAVRRIEANDVPAYATVDSNVQ
jgi:hypothetical protein